MNQNFIDFIYGFLSRPLAIAVSGGVDSVTLLYWMYELGANITCLHVNHGLRSAADVETQYVQDLCKKLGVPCHTFYWNAPKPTTGVEAAARAARYDMMTRWCRNHGVGDLLVAHQSDDQIETFLMNLSRGSGLHGLAAMRPVSVRDGINIVRPLLRVPRAELVKYCDDHGIRYFSDAMNDDLHYTRVRIRKYRRAAQEMLGISDARILLAIDNLGRARDAADAAVARLVDSVLDSDRAVFVDSFLFDLAPDIRLKLLGTLIQRIGGDCYQPRLQSLSAAENRLHNDCQFTLGHCTLRRLGNKILIVSEGSRTSFRKKNEKKQK